MWRGHKQESGVVVGQGLGEGWRGGDSTAGVSVRKAGQGRGRSSNLLQGERRRESGVVISLKGVL